MSDRSRPDQIARIRRLILETLSVGRAIAMRGQVIANIVRLQIDTTYDDGLFEKDLTYLAEREFLRINAQLSGARAMHFAPRDLGPDWHLKVYWELTAAGSEIAQGLRSDPALE